MKPLLFYHCQLRKSSNLLTGRLLLIDTDATKIICEVEACSGAIGHQTVDDLDVVARGGIPEASMAGLDHYAVNTVELSTNLKGIEGEYFNVLPREFIVNGIKRSLIEIHRDANAPGTAGCIGVVNAHWQKFRQAIKSQRERGIKQIPLLVNYSRG
ncbi:hypothetical protein [Scytonema sp. NUACC26]|uniref:hypothetical protein n=1 Tax=Scytonema sp. NUACC26 TaxID=3140176 RepID=UPI0034DC4C20